MHAVLPFDHEVTAAVIWCSFSLPRMHPSSMAAVQSYWGLKSPCKSLEVSRTPCRSSRFAHVCWAGHQLSPNWCCCRCSALCTPQVAERMVSDDVAGDGKQDVATFNDLSKLRINSCKSMSPYVAQRQASLPLHRLFTVSMLR